jgi:predicted permease
MHVMSDVQVAIRRLRGSPGFTTVAVLTLAVGIGANSAVFSLVSRILLKPLPVAHPSEIVSLNGSKGKKTYPNFSYLNYKDIRDRNHALSGVAGYRIVAAGMSQGGINSRLWGYTVTGNYFELLGVNALIGRTISTSDDLKAGGHPVMVLSYACWQSRFGGDSQAIGGTVKINGFDFTVLGVLPRSFGGTELFYNPEVYFPIAMSRQIEPDSNWMNRRQSENMFTIGRLRPGVSVTQAEADLDTVTAGLAREYPDINEGLHVRLCPPGLAGSYLRGAVIGFTAVLLGVTGLVLLIACTNLAGLMLARASDRRREIGIRLALGASRWRLIRQMLVESLILSVTGAAAGLLLSTWITGLLAAWHPPTDLPLDLSSGTDIRVFAFACLLAVATAVVFGLIPAVQAARTDLLSSLKNAGSQAFRRLALRDGIVALQVALSVVLLAGSVLVIRSLQNAMTIPIGFEPRGAAMVSFDLSLLGYNEARAVDLERRLLDRVRSLPGVESAALADRLPLTLDSSGATIYPENRPDLKASEAPHAYTYEASPGYFHTMRTRLLAGRDFEARDEGKTRIVIVNQAFVDQILGGASAVGRRFRFGPGGDFRTIIGVVETGKYFSLGEKPEPAAWESLDQNRERSVALVARSSMPESQLLQLLRKSVLELDPSIPFYQSTTLVDHMRMPLFPARAAASALTAFGMVALLLAGIGVYGLMAYAVARRTREIGLRVALGAQSRDVLRNVLGRASILLGAGLALGIAGAIVGGPFYQAILFNVNPRDPATLALAAALMLAIGLGACLLPAQRAMSIDPSIALREE